MTKKASKKTYGTSGGVEITEELIEKFAKEAEAGYDISRLTPRRGRPPMGGEAATIFQVRLDPDLRTALDERAKSNATTPSEVVRRALRLYLHGH